MSDIIIAGNTFPDVPKIIVPKADGGNAEFTEVWNPLGSDATLIQTYDMGTKKLSETGFSTWTPTSTATSIQATSKLGTIVSPELGTYEYGIKVVFDSKTAYIEGATLKNAVVRQIYAIYSIVYRRPSTLANMASATDNYNMSTTLFTAPWMCYYNTSGTLTMAWTGSYGFYPQMTAVTLGSTIGVNTTITINAPSYRVGCNNTYFNTKSASNVDQDNSTIECKVFVYRMKKYSTLNTLYHVAVDMYNAQ